MPIPHYHEHLHLCPARALGRIGAKDAVPALIQALQDPNEDVRMNAARALGSIGTPEALKAVEEYQLRQ